MKIYFYGIIIILAFGLLCTSCANKVSLTGGPKDEIPPQLDTLKSTPNYQLRFTPQEIVLNFDEFINFKDPSKNVVISPPLQFGMDIDHRGKEIKISFDENEVLKPNATYIINFGESIADYTENNVLKNFSYVCSTGDYIDSLSIGGKVIDAFTKEPVEGITVMLYDNLEDSVVYTESPFYFAKTEGDGSFRLNNLRSDTFKIVAMRDLNLNYRYEPSSEEFAFLDTFLVVVDTTQQDIELLSFQAESTPRFLESDVIHDGLFSLKFDQKIDFSPVTLINRVSHYQENVDKNVMAYVKDIELYPIRFSMLMDTLQDTISIRKPQNKDRKDLPTLKIMKSNISGDAGLHPLDTLALDFNLPLDSLNRALMNMDESEIRIDNENRKRILVINEWEEGADYSLSLDSSAVIDFFGRAMDSTGFDFEVARRNAFGQYSFSLLNIKENQYLISLINSDKKVILDRIVSKDQNDFVVDRLRPGSFSLEIIADQNKNKKWDSGDYDLKKQPEKVKNITINAIESNRTTSFEVDFEMIFNKIDTLSLLPKLKK